MQKSRIPEVRTVSKYANFGNIRPIWERIFLIEIKYFFEKFLSISFRIWIVSNWTTSINVKVYEYRRYLVTNICLWGNDEGSYSSLIWPRLFQL
jgi:hypothetical protein